MAGSETDAGADAVALAVRDLTDCLRKLLLVQTCFTAQHLETVKPVIRPEEYAEARKFLTEVSRVA